MPGVYGGLDGMEEYGVGGAGCIVVLVGWGVWCWGCREYGGRGGMEGFGAGGVGCMGVFVGME